MCQISDLRCSNVLRERDAGNDPTARTLGAFDDRELGEGGVLAGGERFRALVGGMRTIAVPDVPVVGDDRAGGLQSVHGGTVKCEKGRRRPHQRDRHRPPMTERRARPRDDREARPTRQQRGDRLRIELGMERRNDRDVQGPLPRTELFRNDDVAAAFRQERDDDVRMVGRDRYFLPWAATAAAPAAAASGSRYTAGSIGANVSSSL